MRKKKDWNEKVYSFRRREMKHKKHIWKAASHKYKFLYSYKHSESFWLAWLSYHELTMFFIIYGFHLFLWWHTDFCSLVSLMIATEMMNRHKSNKFILRFSPMRAEIKLFSIFWFSSRNQTSSFIIRWKIVENLENNEIHAAILSEWMKFFHDQDHEFYSKKSIDSVEVLTHFISFRYSKIKWTFECHNNLNLSVEVSYK